MVIIDGKEATEPDALKKLPAERIKSFSILKDDTARKAYGDKGKNGVISVVLFTDAEYEYRKANPEKPFADALELAESMPNDADGETVYYIDDKEVSKEELKGMSTKEIKTVTKGQFDNKNIVRLITENYKSDWIPVSGVVKDKAGKPVVAYVTVKGTNDLIKTNSEGAFTMKAPKKGVLLVSDNIRPIVEVKVKPTVEIVLKD
ncbi:hypothetical protein [uncultured Bacteroides sp.]|uniref:hypothetical protein n=1 Tax=uncultured Bacteroides sp. TaxID=162156 RepID=UPI0025D377DD|nr:hypothetical protein [uncultured Bacteroides sp.]